MQRHGERYLSPLSAIFGLLGVVAVGFGLRGNDVWLMLYLAVAGTAGMAAHRAVLFGSRLSNLDTLGAAGVGLGYALATYLVMVELFRFLDTRRWISGARMSSREMRLRLSSLNFRSFNRFRRWVWPLTRSVKRQWPESAALVAASLGALLVITRSVLPQLLNSLVLTAAILSIAALFHIRRCHQASWEIGLPLLGLVVGGLVIIGLPTIAATISWLFVWGSVGFFLAAFNAAEARAGSAMDFNAPLLWEPVYHSAEISREPVIPLPWILTMLALAVSGMLARALILPESTVGATASVLRVAAHIDFAREVLEWNSERLGRPAWMEQRIGMLYHSKADYSAALPHLLESDAKVPSREYTLNLLAASAFYASDDLTAAGALEELSEMGALRPPVASIALALLFYEARFDEAHSYAAELVDSNPRIGWQWVGTLLIEQGRCREFDSVAAIHYE